MPKHKESLAKDDDKPAFEDDAMGFVYKSLSKFIWTFLELFICSFTLLFCLFALFSIKRSE